jgi:mycofactocin system creatininase family protein
MTWQYLHPVTQSVNPPDEPFILSTATWPEADRTARRVLLVPLGALEQHGPHLPLDVDTRVAVAVGDIAARGRAGVGVAPALPIGASGEHAAFPGGLSMGTDALTAVLVELGRDGTRQWDAVLLVNAHGGNRDAVNNAVGRLAVEGRRCEAFHAVVPGGDAHAGRSETSLMLHLAPELVRSTAIEAGNAQPLAALLPVLRRDGVAAVSPNGILGDPAGASAAEGVRLLAQLGAACAARVDVLLAAR